MPCTLIALYMNLTRLSLAFLVGTMFSAPAVSATADARAWMTGAGYAPPTSDLIVACHGYGCTRREALAIDPAWFARISVVMRAGRTSPAAERKALATAIRLYTASISRQLGGEPDRKST